ncbi:hypothetical protein, partial [Victivallis vadensis]|uniref:hypothetical protein n=2 Tax=Victivallis vadensis TaxID=172901 RepID=UPI003CFF8E75
NQMNLDAKIIKPELGVLDRSRQSENAGQACKSLSLNKPNPPDLRRSAIRLSVKIADTSSIVNFIRLRD